MRPIDIAVPILEAGVPVRLASVPTPVARIDIEADGTNTNDVYVGSDQVHSIAGDTRGRRMEAKAVVTLIDIDLYEWWLTGNTAGDRVFGGGEIE